MSEDKEVRPLREVVRERVMAAETAFSDDVQRLKRELKLASIVEAEEAHPSLLSVIQQFDAVTHRTIARLTLERDILQAQLDRIHNEAFVEAQRGSGRMLEAALAGAELQKRENGFPAPQPYVVTVSVRGVQGAGKSSIAAWIGHQIRLFGFVGDTKVECAYDEGCARRVMSMRERITINVDDGSRS